MECAKADEVSAASENFLVNVEIQKLYVELARVQRLAGAAAGGAAA